MPDDRCACADCPAHGPILADYARLQGLMGSTEEAVRGAEDVRERLALMDELVPAARELAEKKGCNDPDCCTLSIEEAAARAALKAVLAKVTK